jgi:poly(3-hydroxybutyrate) depolymerase
MCFGACGPEAGYEPPGMRTWLILVLAGALSAATSAGTETETLYRPVRNESTLNYLLHLPRHYHAGEKAFPLLFFLHGIAQKGNGSIESLEKVAEDGPFRTMRDGRWDSSLPLIVVGPQSSGLLPWWRGAEVRRVLDHIVATYRVDPSRRYLTGISMGGRSAWWLAKNFSNEFAAIVPASTWAGELSRSCEVFRRLGVWAFHGGRDPLIGLSAGQRPIQALNACTPPLRPAPKITVLEDAGHGQWHRIYANEHGEANVGGDGRRYTDIYRWMLSFSL